MAARLSRLVVLGLLVGTVVSSPAAAAALVRLPTSHQTAQSAVPARGAGPANARSYFGARHYQALWGRFTTIDPVYTWQENLVDPQRWNRHAYVRNNPLRYVDPTGEAIETLWDIANIVMGAKSAYENFKAGRYAAAAVDAVGVVLDAGAGAVPGLPGGAGTAIKTARAVDRADDLLETAKGGTYILRDVDGVVMRTGRSNNLERRMADHARDAKTKDLTFEVDRRTDVYAEQRGREQVIHDTHKPPLNRINPIDPRNPNRQKYLDAAKRLEDK